MTKTASGASALSVKKGEEGVAMTIARWVALAGLFLVPLTPLIVSDNYFFPFITGKAFFFRIVVEVAFAGWVVLALADRRYRPRWSWISVALTAFVAWMFIADLFAVNPEKAFWSNFERMEGWITLIHLLALFVVSGAVLRVEKKWRAWWLVSLGVAAVVMLYSFLQIAGGLAIHQGSTRVDATLGNAAYLAVYMLFHVFVALWLAFTTDKKWLRYVLLGFAILAAFVLFATATRGTILGLAGGLLLAVLLMLFTMGKRARGVAAGALVLLLVLAGGFLLVRDTPAIRQHPVLGRIASISLAEGQTRFTIWHMAFEGFAESPKTVLVGWGQEGFNYVFNKYYQPSLYQQEQWFDRAHNAFIDWLVAGGLPAFLLYIALFGAAVWELWRRPFSRAEQIALTALLAGYAFHNLFVFDNTVSYIGFIAVLALIDSAASRPVRAFEEKPELSPELVPVGALPVAAVLLALLIGLLDVPGMNAASGLITALTPQPTFADTLNAWKQELAHPAFAAQEIREQLLTFATQVAGMSQVSDADKQTLVTLALSEMQKEAEALPQDARVRFELAVGYASFGDYKDALAQMAIARSLSPKKVTIILEEGVIRLQANDLAGAAQDFKEAYALAPQFQSLVPYGAAGDILSGNAGAAQATLARSFGTTTVDSPVLIEAYALTKNYLPLIPIYRMRAAKPGSSIDDAFRLAIAEAAAGQTQEAIAQVRAVMAAHPEATQAGEALIQQIQQGKIR